MSKIALNEITVKSLKHRAYLISYLNNMRSYYNFDPTQLVQIFVNKDKDFCAFESIEHKMQFTSADHRIEEIVHSPYILDYVPFNVFYDYILSLN